MIKKFTEEQRKEWEEKQKDQLKKLSSVITNAAENFHSNPEDIAELVSFGSQFYNYSYRNTVLIYSQNPYAAYVQSYQAWKESGYHVKAGEKGIQIFVPVKVTYLDLEKGQSIPLSQATDTQKKAYTNGQIPSHTSIRFSTGYVYDISQTTCPVSAYPNFYHMGYANEKCPVLIEGLKLYASDHLKTDILVADLKSITLRGDFLPAPDSLGRYKIRLNEKLKDTEMLSTETHELGHAVLHRYGTGKSPSQMELEADCFSIMLSNHLGVEISDTRKHHLASHYKQYQAEENSFALEEIVSNVYQIYKKEVPKIDQSINSAILKEQQLERHQDALADIHSTILTEFSPISVDTIAYYTTLPENPIPQVHLDFKFALKEFINAGNIEGKMLGYFDQRDADLHPLLAQLKNGLSITPENEILSSGMDIIKNPYDRQILESYYQAYDYMKEYYKELEITKAAQIKDYPPTVTILHSDTPDLKPGASYPINDMNDYFYDKSRKISGLITSPLDYEKVKFRIDFRHNGKAQSYEGRYDIGSERKSLINHIADHASKQLEDTETQEHLRKFLGDGYVKRHIEQCSYIKNELVPYLEMHGQLSSLEVIAKKSNRETYDEQELSYKRRLMNYVRVWRDKLNNCPEKIDALPEAPHMDDLILGESQVPADPLSQTLPHINKNKDISFNK